MYVSYDRELRFPVLQLPKQAIQALIALAILIIAVPFIIKSRTIYTTQYIFLAATAPILIIRLIDYTTEKVEIEFQFIKDQSKFFEWISKAWLTSKMSQALDFLWNWLMTIVILSVSVPVCVIIGFIAIGLTWFFRELKIGKFRFIEHFPNAPFFFAWHVVNITFFLLAVRVKINGIVPQDKKTYVVVVNHGSFIDYFFTLLIIIVMKRPCTMVYGTNLHKYPIMGTFLKWYGLGVDRTSDESRRSTNEAIIEALRNGISVVIFAEGTRMRKHQIHEVLLPFKNGAFTSAIETNSDILPVVLDKPILYSSPNRPLPLSPQKITVTFCEPIESMGRKVNDLKKETHAGMKALLQ